MLRHRRLLRPQPACFSPCAGTKRALWSRSACFTRRTCSHCPQIASTSPRWLRLRGADHASLLPVIRLQRRRALRDAHAARLLRSPGLFFLVFFGWFCVRVRGCGGDCRRVCARRCSPVDCAIRMWCCQLRQKSPRTCERRTRLTAHFALNADAPEGLKCFPPSVRTVLANVRAARTPRRFPMSACHGPSRPRCLSGRARLRSPRCACQSSAVKIRIKCL